ncbi:MAG: hypothetical protein IJU87_02285 [Lachnospiraceae bacterium]|nr:hypothetical protein [Lachnospiraceae bacterium]
MEVKDQIDEDPGLIFLRFPVLEEKEKIVTENFIAAQIELLDRYAADRDKISERIFDGKKPEGSAPLWHISYKNETDKEQYE